MDFIISLINQLAATQPWAVYVLAGLGGLGGLTVIASAIVLMTPTKKDDELLAKFQAGSISGQIWKTLRGFSVVKQKDAP